MSSDTDQHPLGKKLLMVGNPHLRHILEKKMLQLLKYFPEEEIALSEEAALTLRFAGPWGHV